MCNKGDRRLTDIGGISVTLMSVYLSGSKFSFPNYCVVMRFGAGSRVKRVSLTGGRAACRELAARPRPRKLQTSMQPPPSSCTVAPGDLGRSAISFFSRLFWDCSKTSPPNSCEVKPAQLSLGTRSDKEWLFKCWDKCWVTRLNNDFPNVMQLNLQLNLQLLYIQLHRWVKATAAETFLWILASLCSAAKLLLSEHCDPACNAVQLSLSNGNDNASNAIKCYCARGCISVCTYVLFAKLNF